MKTQTINLKYSFARARALSHYLEKDGRTIEGELLDHIDCLYDAHVPKEVRELAASQHPKDIQEDEKNKQIQDEGNHHTQYESGPVLVM